MFSSVTPGTVTIPAGLAGALPVVTGIAPCGGEFGVIGMMRTLRGALGSSRRALLLALRRRRHADDDAAGGVGALLLAQPVEKLLVGVGEALAVGHDRLDLVGPGVAGGDARGRTAAGGEEGLVGVGQRAAEADRANQRRRNHHAAATAARLLLLLGQDLVVVGVVLAIAVGGLEAGGIVLARQRPGIEVGVMLTRIARLEVSGLAPLMELALLRGRKRRCGRGHVVAEIETARVGLRRPARRRLRLLRLLPKAGRGMGQALERKRAPGGGLRRVGRSRLGLGLSLREVVALVLLLRVPVLGPEGLRLARLGRVSVGDRLRLRLPERRLRRIARLLAGGGVLGECGLRRVLRLRIDVLRRPLRCALSRRRRRERIVGQRSSSLRLRSRPRENRTVPRHVGVLYSFAPFAPRRIATLSHLLRGVYANNRQSRCQNLCIGTDQGEA